MSEEDKVTNEDYRRKCQSPDFYTMYNTIPNYEEKRDLSSGNTTNEKNIIKYLEAKIEIYVNQITLG